jgi:3-isopropylmalate dehydrogenase
MDLKIALLPGDGIGPEIIEQAVLVSNKIAQRFNHNIIWKNGLVGAAAIEDCGNPYPDKTHKICLESDAILFGAIGDPKYDNDPSAKVRPEQGFIENAKRFGVVCQHTTYFYFSIPY